MNVTCKPQDLRAGLKIAGRAVASKWATLPVLNNVHLAAGNQPAKRGLDEPTLVGHHFQRHHRAAPLLHSFHQRRAAERERQTSPR